MQNRQRGRAVSALPVSSLLLGFLLSLVLSLAGCQGSTGQPKPPPEPKPGTPAWVALQYWQAYYLGQDFGRAWDLMTNHEQQANAHGSRDEYMQIWQSLYHNPKPTPAYRLVEQKVTDEKYLETLRLPNHEIEDVQITVVLDNGQWRVKEGDRLQ